MNTLINWLYASLGTAASRKECNKSYQIRPKNVQSVLSDLALYVLGRIHNLQISRFLFFRDQSAIRLLKDCTLSLEALYPSGRGPKAQRNTFKHK